MAKCALSVYSRLFGQLKIGLLKIRSFYVRSNGIGLLALGLLKLGLLGGHHVLCPKNKFPGVK
jgi:hypothetical protein